VTGAAVALCGFVFLMITRPAEERPALATV
jgi:hypothetical protein